MNVLESGEGGDGGGPAEAEATELKQVRGLCGAKASQGLYLRSAGREGRPLRWAGRATE